ncbi:Phox/Bem1p [Cynara cardunculus var. scolymus]|uniref:Phox/Bem1p n=1 Tax=Cynara cardunculus var. scolymus TaxID=59895 RepID=A0A103Y9U4_CYNCS|nr:Phox/Bem1p [Cynara cardunculus var. scolymus]
MDFDYMDELLLDGCWLQATDGSDPLNNNNPSNSTPLLDPSFQWPNLESTIGEPVSKDILLAPEGNPSKSHLTNLIGSPADQSENLSELSKRWWIGPRASSSPSLSVMEKLIYAIDNIKHYTVDKNVLIQVWLPETRDGKKVLSTSQRLFSLELNCPRLSNYRSISEGYHFPAEGDAKESVGLPGRVFMGKVPEWTPDVRFFKIEEYPRVSHAQEQDVRGSVAVPVFDQDIKICIGVVEVVMTTQKSNYNLEIQSVCKALEVSKSFYHPAIPEILETLKSACMMHNLPLAQTWIPCIQQGGKGGCRYSSDNLIHCISTVDSASYLSDPRFKDFQEACSQHHLFKGQGVVGKAFTTNEPCYSPDVTLYTKTEYPLAHHARIFDLHAEVAIRLRTTYAASIDFVLEFFLPVDCKNHKDQMGVVDSLLMIIKKVCGSLRIVTEMELQEEEGLLMVSDTEPVQKTQETAFGGAVSGLGLGMEKRRAVHGGSGSFQIESFYSNFPKLASPGPSKTNPIPFSASKIETFDSKAADGATATSCSQGSSSSQSFSGGTHQVQQVDEDTVEGALKRTKSDADIHTFSASSDQDQEPKLFPRSHSHKSIHEPPKCQNLPPKPRLMPDGHLRRVKVTFGEEKVRFRLQKDWGYNDLLQEIGKRFRLNDISGLHLKYLDDDSEWVLLTCDADLEECIDVYRSFKSGTIRLALREPQLRVGSSLGSNAPL